jgi:hypothetical protein
MLAFVSHSPSTYFSHFWLDGRLCRSCCTSIGLELHRLPHHPLPHHPRRRLPHRPPTPSKTAARRTKKKMQSKKNKMQTTKKVNCNHHRHRHLHRLPHLRLITMIAKNGCKSRIRTVSVRSRIPVGARRKLGGCLFTWVPRLRRSSVTSIACWTNFSSAHPFKSNRALRTVTTRALMRAESGRNPWPSSVTVQYEQHVLF